MVISLRGEKRGVTKIPNWATDWPVLLKASTDGVQKWEKAGHEEAPSESWLLLIGARRHFCARCCSN